MKILFLGEYDPGEIIVAPVKVGKELFNAFNKIGLNVVYLPYFQDGNIYSRIQKIFGFEKITDRVYRTGICPLLSFVIKFRPQIIHIITPGLYYAPLFLLRFFFRYKIISTLHSINRYAIPNYSSIKGYQKFRFLFIDYLLVKFSDCVFVYSERDKRYISMFCKIKQEKIRIVNNGFNGSNLRKENFSVSSCLKVAFVGQINRKEKAFDFLLNALELFNLPVKLSVFSHAEQKEIENYKTINIDLQIYKPLGELEFRKELINNDILIIPSEYESFSISLLEAMNTGIIFLASSRVGLTDRFNPKLKSLVFKKGNAKDLIDRINFYLKMDNSQKLSLSAEIINFTINYSWDKISDDYLKAYSRVF